MSQELLEEVERSPEGPQVGAFFDFDGTLIDGYSARVFYEDQIRRFELSAGELARSAVAGIEMAVRKTDVSKLMRVAVANWAGHREEEVSDLFERLFVKRIAGMVYPEARELVKAHRRRGHTVVLASSATRYQIDALARDFEVEDVLCSEVEVVRGYFSGFLDGEVLWGLAKAGAVKRFAAEHGVGLKRSFAYANGDEDVAVPGDGRQPAATESAERPGAGGPGSRLAGDRSPRAGTGWTRRDGRRRAHWRSPRRPWRGRAESGWPIGLLNGDRRQGANVAAAIGPDLALALAGVELNVVGSENLWSQRPAVFIFNHQSSIDVAVIGSLVRRDLTGVAKQEAARDPRFAPIGYVVDVVYIDRSNSRQARAALEPAVERLKRRHLDRDRAGGHTQSHARGSGRSRRAPFTSRCRRAFRSCRS